MSALLTLDRLSLAAPDGRRLFSDLTLAVGRERVGIVGRNGAGKSTLLHAIAGGSVPASGTITRACPVAMLRQSQDAETVGALLGVASALAALARIERGEGSEADFETADWALPGKIESALSRFGLGPIDLERPAASFSGGERTRLGLARLLLDAPGLILLDEPTNNLDAAGCRAVIEMLGDWAGGALVASHDRDLLEQVDRIVELSPIGVTITAGGWSEHESSRDAARARAADALERADAGLRAAERQAQSARERQARRDSGGRSYAASGSAPRIALGLAKRRAEATAGRSERRTAQDVRQAETLREAADAALERVVPIAMALPPSKLPANRTVLDFRDVVLEVGGDRLFGPLTFAVTGPARVVVSGPNGAGKSSLLKLVTGALSPSRGTVSAGVSCACLDQHVGLLRDEASLIDNLKHAQPGLSDNAAHAALARFAFRNRDALRLAGSLSGGERLRAGLACVMSGGTTPQLLLLDEPTNHLDLASIEELEAALTAYDGALLIVSHDREFLARVGVTREIALGEA